MKTSGKRAVKADVTQSPTGERPENQDAEVPRPVATPDAPSHEDQIRAAAYQRYLDRGQAHGAHEDDWYEAEKEVRPPDGN